ncbi:MAG: PRC-barrel domain-containing protein [Pseudomonadota bacterium]
MNRTILTLAAATMLVSSALPAFAETKQTTTNNSNEKLTTEQVKKDAKEAWSDLKGATKEAGREIEALFLGEDENVPPKSTMYKSVSSASGLLGTYVNGFNNKKVGKLKDIIVDGDGMATHAIVADNDIPGFEGKLVAVPYTSVFQSTATGDISAALSEAAIEGAREFSYTPSSGKNVVVLPAGHYSVVEILDGDVLNAGGEDVGSVDDLYFKGGKADTVIVGFDKVMGMGGKDVAAFVGPTTFVPGDEADDDVDVKLSAKQSATFAKYKKNVNK